MAPTPGILYVTMQPKPSLPISQFHDWYNNEHGPTRLRLPFVINGFRYRANDLEGAAPSEEKPEWMAVYDITDMDELTKDTYLRLRDQPVKSQREADTMKEIKVDRKLYDHIQTWESKDFKVMEKVENEGEGNVVVAVFLSLFPGEEQVKEVEKWYQQEHVDMLAKVPGWQRTRRFVTSSIDPKAPVEYLALHEYKPRNGLGGKEFQAAVSTPWAQEIMKTTVKNKGRRVYDLYYTFGPAPRYLASNLASWQSSDVKSSLTKTLLDSPGGAGAIESFITTKDGVEIPFRLEGSQDPDAPLIVLSNSILVDYKIWDGFLASFFAVPANKKYRVLRYLTRGRSSSCGTLKVTVDVLAADIVALLDALRVKKAAAVIGVSLGGCTTLNTALKYPNRVDSFISCDTSSKSPAGNSKAWGERIALSEKESASTSSGEKIVGEELAEITTRRWFVKESYDGGEMEKTCLQVKDMVKNNSLEGFKKSVEALFEYDLKEEMKTSAVKGAFVVGSGDGVLPSAMKEMAASYGSSGAAYEVIDEAGHLPMVEKPQQFAAVVTKLLG
ncbi:Alpha/Beta hydrolase protein [Rhexocercosporidium sp. MPI-PUGE-AT-0058]|nr:Alpha/Beta hydrolase protein [Rhexocercosporidium sp. MPI-PUGE-AT-0058]